jgi:hypothetical protein
VETIIDTAPMRKALIRITSKIKSTWQFDKYKVTGRAYIMKDLHRRTELTRRQLSLINQDDFILTDLVGREGKRTKGMDRQRVDLRKYAEHLDYNLPITHHLNQYDQLAATVKGRKKRSLDFLGEMWHFVSGAPGPDQYNMEHKNLEKIKISLFHQNNLTAKQADEINLLRNTIHNHDIDISKTMQTMDQVIKRDANETYTDIKRFYLVTFYIKCQEILEEIDMHLNNIKIGLNEASSGKLSTLIVPKKNLTQILKNIASKARTETPVFPLEDIQQFYELKSTHAYRRKGKIHFFTRIPLVDPKHTAKLYEIPPSVKISTGTKEDFILLDKTNLYYSTARYHDVLKYIRIRNYGYICGERQVEISMRGQQSPEKHLDQFSLTRLTRQNFAISSKSEIRAKVICNDNVTLITLPRHSHLTLPESCSIHSDTFIIYANEQKGLKEIYVSDHYNIEDIQPAMDAFNNKLINALSTAIRVDPLTKI